MRIKKTDQAREVESTAPGVSFPALRRWFDLLRRRPAPGSDRGGERTHRILRASVAALFSRTLGTLLGLVTAPVALAYLGKSGFAAWALLGQVAGWATVLTLGLPNGLLNVLLKHHGAGDRTAARQAIATIGWLLALVALVAGVALCVLVPMGPFARFLGIEAAAPAGTAESATLVTLLFALVGLPLALAPQILAASQRMHVSNLASAATAFLQLGALLLAVFLHRGFVGVVVLMGGAGLAVQLIFGWLAVSGPDRDLRPQRADCSTQALRQVGVLSIPLCLFQLGALAVNNTQLMVLSQTTRPEVVADYSILMRLFFPIALLIQLITQPFFPALRDARERREQEWVRRSFRRVLLVRLSLAAGCVGLFLIAGNQVLAVWLRGSVVQFDWRVWAALSALLLTSVWTSAFSDLLTICDRIWPLVWIVITNGAITVLLTLLLAPRLGLLGALLAFSAFNLVAGCWMLPWLARSLLRPDPATTNL